jgi:hypothetical protein
MTRHEDRGHRGVEEKSDTRSRMSADTEAASSPVERIEILELEILGIVAAGIGGKELSPEDIYRAMNTEDRDTYDLEVTGLRKSGILQELRSSSAAQQMARVRRVPKGKIPRFRVVSQTGKAAVAQPQAALKASSLIRRELFPEETGIFVGNLGNETTERDLRGVFQRFGTVRKIITGFDKRPGSAARYAVVWLESADAAQKAIDALYGFKLDNRELVLNRFRAKSQPMRRNPSRVPAFVSRVQSHRRNFREQT